MMYTAAAPLRDSLSSCKDSQHNDAHMQTLPVREAQLFTLVRNSILCKYMYQ